MDDYTERKSPEDPNAVYLSDETYGVVGAAMEVYYKLGSGFLEPVYQQAVAIELELRGIPFRREERFTISYKGRMLDREYIADFFVTTRSWSSLRRSANFHRWIGLR